MQLCLKVGVREEYEKKKKKENKERSDSLSIVIKGGLSYSKPYPYYRNLYTAEEKSK